MILHHDGASPLVLAKMMVWCGEDEMVLLCDDGGIFSGFHLQANVTTRLVVVPLVKDNGCHKIKVNVLLQRVTPLSHR